MNSKNTILDYSYSILSLVTMSLSVVLIHHAADSLPPSLTLLASTLIAILFFHLVNVGKIFLLYKKAWETKKMWLMIMITIALVWLATIYGPAYVSPALYILLYFASSCVLGIIFDYKTTNNPYLIIAGIGISLCSVGLTYEYIYSNSSLDTWLGVGLGLLGGITSFIYLKLSHVFSTSNQLSATQVLALRFWLVLVCCILLLPHHSMQYLHFNSLLIIVGVAFFSLILPVFFTMKSILKVGVEKSVIVSGLVPATTYLLQSASSHFFDMKALVLYLMTGFFIALPYGIRLIKSQQSRDR